MVVDSRLYHLWQGEQLVSLYTSEFRTLALQTSWSCVALHTAYFEGLSGRMKRELAARELPETLVQLCLHVDLRLANTAPPLVTNIQSPALPLSSRHHPSLRPILQEPELGNLCR